MSDDALDKLKARMSAGEPYDGNDPLLLPDRRRCARLLDSLNSVAVTDSATRRAIFTELVAEVGEGGWVMPGFLCEFGFFIRVGARTRINFDVMMLDCAPITVGSDVMIAPRCMLLAGSHPLARGPRHAGWEEARPITLEDGVWLGAGAIVVPGVTIGRDTVVGAGSVVTRDLPAGVVAAGNPARIVRDRLPEETPA